MIILEKMAVIAVISVSVYLLVALVLILSQWPAARVQTPGGLDFSQQVMPRAKREVAVTFIGARDGARLPIYSYSRVRAGAPRPLVLLLHGSGWHGLQFDALARGLAPVADIIAPDLRGHGFIPARRGDINHIGQLEEDIADLIRALQKPGQKVILGGHSSGAGLVVRFAGGKYGDMIDGAVLLAPFLKYDAPTTRRDAGGWARPLTRRLIGLSMLNAVGITALNRLTVIQFTFPDSVRTGPLGDSVTDAYSYRMMTSFAPRRAYLKDVAKLPNFLLVAGSADESFIAAKYEPTMKTATDKGQYHLINGVSHLAIVDAPQTAALMRTFIGQVQDGY